VDKSVAIASGDLDGNASADLAIVNKTDNSVTVLLNNGDGTLLRGRIRRSLRQPTPRELPSRTSIKTAKRISPSRAEIRIRFEYFSESLQASSHLGLNRPRPSGSTPTAIVTAQLVSGGFPDVAITNNVTGAAGDVTVVLSPASLFSSSGLTQQPYPLPNTSTSE